MTDYPSKNSDILYKTDFLQLKQTNYANGKKWFYAHRHNAKNIVVIIPVIKKCENTKIVFLTTKRPPLIAEEKAEFCIEFPAGLVGDENEKETVDTAIQKELLEETGLKADKTFICAPLVSSSSGCTSETSVIAISEIYEEKLYQTPVSDNGIIEQIHKIPVCDVDNWLLQKQKEKYAISSQVFAGLYFLKMHLDNVNNC